MNLADRTKECFIGMDIGGTYIKAGVVGVDGKVWAQRHQDVQRNDLGSLIRQIVSLANELKLADPTLQVMGIGVGFPGLISAKDSVISLSPNIPALNGIHLKEILTDQLGWPAVIENDANAGAYGEMWLGAATSVTNFIYISIGTRVGAAIVLNRQIYRGVGGYAGELGHTSVVPDGKACFCGRTGCLEAYVSAPSIAQRVEERLNLNPSSALQIITDRPVNAQDVSAAASLGDPMAIVIVGEVARYLGLAIANLIDFLNPELVILGGGVIGAGNVLLQLTIEEVRRRVLSPCFEDCQIVCSQLGPSAGVIGASLLARDASPSLHSSG
ncbi:MAG TPA: ROK family protein [Terriglobia bacterium]|nr:ROK family protein [Terriglobia bacterium]